MRLTHRGCSLGSNGLLSGSYSSCQVSLRSTRLASIIMHHGHREGGCYHTIHPESYLASYVFEQFDIQDYRLLLASSCLFALYSLKSQVYRSKYI